MKKKKNVISILLALALITTSFGSDYGASRAYAIENEDGMQNIAEDEIKTVEWEKVLEDGDSLNEASGTLSESSEMEVNEDFESDISTESEPSVDDSIAASSEYAEEVIASDSSEEISNCEAAETSSDSNEGSSVYAAEEASSDATEGISNDASGEASLEEKLVTISYNATKGGSVSNRKETINLNSSESIPEGATATPWNDEYAFTYWTDEDGNQISSEATLVPDEVTEDTVYTANFVSIETISDTMPAIVVNDVHKGGFIVSVNAEEGLFPAGTEVVITEISDSQALDTAKDTLGDTVTSAKAVDIKFVYGENEIQPVDFQYVHISLSLEDTIEGESFTVLHEHAGDVKEIKNANVSTEDVNNDSSDNTQIATAAEFDVNQFSIFIIAGQGDNSSNDSDDGRSVATIRFYKDLKDSSDNEIIFEKKVKQGDTILNPGMPKISDNQEFVGWYIEGDTTSEDNKIAFSPSDDNPKSTYTIGYVQQDAEINVYPVVRTSYYITFVGSDGEIIKVIKVTVENEEDKYYDVTTEEATAGAGKEFKGWSTVKGDLNSIVKTVDVTQGNLILYATVVDAYWIRFDGNGSGSTYTDPVYAENGETLKTALNRVASVPERTGYEFKGWSFGKSSDNKVLTEDELNTQIQDVATLDNEKKELYLYAVWQAKDKTKITIIEWHQNITLDDYDYANSYEKEVTAGSTISVSEDNGKVTISTSAGDDDIVISSFSKGFTYNKSNGSYYTITETESDAAGNVVNKDTSIADASGNTVVNIYEQREKITLTFKIYKDGEWTTYKTITKGYGQTLDTTDSKWPDEYSWYVSYEGSKTKGTHVTFLNALLFDLTMYGEANPTSGHKFYHFKQNIDGTYDIDESMATNVGIGPGDGFDFYDKYNAFSVVRYLKASSITNTDWENWNQCYDSQKNSVGTGDTKTKLAKDDNLYILHERHKFDLVLKITDPVTGEVKEEKVTDIPFEQVLEDNTDVQEKRYAEEGYTPEEKPGYTFAWYKDPTGTTKFDFSMQMPDGGVVAYGIYRPVTYEIRLHPNGGEFISGLQDAEYNVSGADEDLSSRSIYVLSTQDVERNKLLTGIKKDGYEFVGWFYNTENNNEFKYGRVTEFTDLVALWRSQGYTKVVFKAGEHGSYAGNEKEYIPEYNYATNSAVVVAAPPSYILNDEENKKYYTFIGWEIQGNDGTIFYPNDAFTIEDKIINAGEIRVENGKEIRYVVANAVYLESSEPGGVDELTSIIYDPNIEVAGADFGQSQVKEDNNLKINNSVKAKEALFTKKGYIQTSWNTMPDGTGLEVPLGAEIAADNVDRIKNSKSNILYAQYEAAQITVEIEGTTKEETYNGKEYTNADYIVSRAYYFDNAGREIAINKDDLAINYIGDGVKGTDVKLDSKGNIIAYEEVIAATDFESKSVRYPKVSFKISDNNLLKLKISPKQLSVTSGSAKKKYDGTAITNSVTTVSGLVDGETAIAVATGSQTEVGISQNSYYMSWGTAKKTNYIVAIEKLGTLEIYDDSVPVDPTPTPVDPTPTPVDPTPTPVDPTPTPVDPTPTPVDPTPTPVDPTPTPVDSTSTSSVTVSDTSSTPEIESEPVAAVVIPEPVVDQAVLGARRETISSIDLPEVLGARRPNTEDETNDTARMVVVVIAAGIVITLLLAGKRKKENEKQ